MTPQNQTDQQQWIIIPERLEHRLVFFPEDEEETPTTEPILAWRFNAARGIPEPITIYGLLSDTSDSYSDEVWCVQQPINHPDDECPDGWRYVFIGEQTGFLNLEDARAHARTQWTKRRQLSPVPA